jgi:voltage-gated potassium channel
MSEQVAPRMAEHAEAAAYPHNVRADGWRGHPATKPAPLPPTLDDQQAAIDEHRWEILQRLQCWLETPMVVLGFVWLALLVVDLVWGVSPLLRDLSNLIWILFGVDFAIRLLLAPKKLAFLKANWLMAISLAVPALRTIRIVGALRVLRVAQATRGLQLLRLVASINRSMQALGATMGRRGFGYVAGLTALVTAATAAGMYAFEGNLPGGGLDNYGAALWFTIMILTTLGSDYWPKTPEGRMLCILLSIYAIGVFGYITATLASFFVDRDAESGAGELVGERSVAALREEVAALREEIRALASNLRASGVTGSGSSGMRPPARSATESAHTYSVPSPEKGERDR